MAKTQRTARQVCIAIAFLAVAFAAAPSATAICVGPGSEPWNWDHDGSCLYSQSPPQTSPQNTVVCVSNNVNNCA